MKRNFINLKKFENIVNCGFFTAKGGVSKGNFYSLNCNEGSNDSNKNVKKNINLALEKLGIENKKLKLLNQIHSNKIFLVSKKNYLNQFNGDGLITKDKDIVLGVLTADCAPVFLFDIHKKIVCCIHSGWKGALLNIAGNSVKKFKVNKIKATNVIAIVGPCLGYNNFEVDKDFKKKFINKNISYINFFKSKNNKKDFFNLRGLINFQLKNEGIKKIYNINRDTYVDNRTFFSYRKATHKNMKDTGRMINIISIRD
tara:strand:+ start:2350 stop:3117 length:768 start_codon:yes stop_codon:yes gene_type:complete